jgi:indolepyruvate ferredoxin oxidoreductase
LVERRCRELTAYQDARYADRYRAFVMRVADREQQLGLGTGLAETVARYYCKLLAYKDEFEVARLYSTPAFRRELEDTFEGDYRLRFQLGAGPFARREAEGAEPGKTEVGAWILPVFGVLAGLRFLRGTALDPFARSGDRRSALQAIGQYEADIERLLLELGAANHQLAIDIAALPEKLRGYGHVRERTALAAAETRTALWRRWQRRSDLAPIPEVAC